MTEDHNKLIEKFKGYKNICVDVGVIDKLRIL